MTPPPGPQALPTAAGEAPHVLLVDDDSRILGLLKRYLGDRGFMVTTAENADQARRQLAALTFDLVVLDVMMPGEPGDALCRDLRAEGLGTPILMLTARSEVEDRLNGLDSGADDYLGKPFDPRELVMRLNALSRRANRLSPSPPPTGIAPGALDLGAHVFDPAREELSRDGQPVHLTTGEMALLVALAARPGEAISREDLADLTGADGNARAIDVQVTRLRRKIGDDPRAPQYLRTVRGKGYMLRPGRGPGT